MALSDKQKNKRDNLSPFGEWMDEKAVREGTSLQEIAKYIGQEYAFVSRLSAGTKNPTYEMAMQIGEMVDDVAGAVRAAGFTPPASAPKAPPSPPAAPTRRLLASGDEITLRPDDTNPDDTAQQVEAFLIALRAAR